MSFFAYLRRRCACCDARIKKGQEWNAMYAFERLCETCFRSCVAVNGQWVHRGRAA